MAFLTLVGITYLMLFSLKDNKKHTGKLIGLFILLLSTIIFFAASTQINGTMVMFIDKHINHTILGWKAPATIFCSLEPLTAFLISPLVSGVWNYLQVKRDISVTIVNKFCAGLFFTALSLLIFAFATQLSPLTLMPLLTLSLANIVLGLAAAIIIPISMAAVSIFTPAHVKSTMMGMLCMTSAIGGIVVSMFSSTNLHTQMGVHTAYSSIYLGMFIIASLITFFIVLLNTKISGLLGEKTHDAARYGKSNLA